MKWRVTYTDSLGRELRFVVEHREEVQAKILAGLQFAVSPTQVFDRRFYRPWLRPKWTSVIVPLEKETDA
jgi:hypothetical protein